MIRDLIYPEDAQKVIDSLHNGLRYDASISILGLASSQLPVKDNKPDFSVGIRIGGLSEDKFVRRDAPGLLSRFSLILMVSRLEKSAQNLLLQRRVLEELGNTGKKMTPANMWRILKRVNKKSRGGSVKLCSELVVEKPTKLLEKRMQWLKGIVKVRNCLAHRLGQVELIDVKPEGKSLEEIKESDMLEAIWLKPKAFVDDEEVKKYPHKGGEKLDIRFEEYRKTWKVGDIIEITPSDCQAIGISLHTLGNHLLHNFESEMNRFLGIE